MNNNIIIKKNKSSNNIIQFKKSTINLRNKFKMKQNYKIIKRENKKEEK